MRRSEKKIDGTSNIEELDKTIEIPDFVTGRNNENWQYYEEPQEKREYHVPKKVRNKFYVRAAYIFSALFLSLVGYLVYFNLQLSETLNKNPYNSKMDSKISNVVRGRIYSADDQVLAGTNVDEEGSEVRVYPFSNVFSHIVGYQSLGKSGLEAIYNNDLLTSNSSIQDHIGSENSNSKLKGDNLILTLDSRMQQAAYNALGAYRGAVVVMEPSTGKILAMVSKPDFDPNNIEAEWEGLNADDARSPLLNRATQGLYPPGSTFKIVTALEYLKEHPDDYQSYSFDCQGYTSNDDVTIKCYDYEVHGYEDLKGSFQHSCNTSFANIGLQLDLPSFKELAGNLLFNQKLPTVLAYSSSKFFLNEKSSKGDIMTTSIGQGDTLVSPFHMALITCAVANKGILMYPYVVDRIENSKGVLVNQTKPMQYKELMTAKEASILKEFMQSVVEGGTASSLSGLEYSIAGKTGSAEYEVDGNTGEEENFSTHSWFVGFSNVEKPDIVVSVIAEDGGTGSSAAVPIARELFYTYYNSVKTGEAENNSEEYPSYDDGDVESYDNYESYDNSEYMNNGEDGFDFIDQDAITIYSEDYYSEDYTY